MLAPAAVWVVGFTSTVKFVVALSVEERFPGRARIDQTPHGLQSTWVRSRQMGALA